MLIEFTVGNFLSFKDKRTISFEAKSISELKNNVVSISGYKLLKSLVLYGANSSGKSNLIKALELMKDIVTYSVKLNNNEQLEYSPFLLSTESEKRPTFFEIVFLINDVKYRYGFEYDQKEIINEWLFACTKLKKEEFLFIRTLDGIGISDDYKEGAGKETSTNNNRLFLSLVAQLGGEIAKQIVEWFTEGYNIISGVEHDDYKSYTVRMFHKKLNGCNESLALFKKLNLGFKELNPIESEFNPMEIPKQIPPKLKDKLIKELAGKTQVSLTTTHNKFDKNGNIVDLVSWKREDNESQGTNKLIDLSGPLFDTLNLGLFLGIDELDSKLHPLISIEIVKLFNDPNKNPNNAQLLFATHDTNLLSSDLFRRDQIWFTEKDKLEQTDLYSLYDFNLPDGKKVINDGNYEKNYIRGRYGAIPFITN